MLVQLDHHLLKQKKEVQGAQTTTMKQPCTVRAILHVSYPQHDMIHESESKLSTFADSCLAPERGRQMIF